MPIQFIEANKAPNPKERRSEEQLMFDKMLIEAKDKDLVGFLELEQDDRRTSIKQKLTHASRRTGIRIDKWDWGNGIYFQVSRKGQVETQREEAQAAQYAA